MRKLLSFKIIIITIVIVKITVLGIVFFLVQPKKTISPVSSLTLENKSSINSLIAKTPSKTLKVYTDDSGFSFKYPEDVIVTKKETSDSSVYSNLELSSYQAKGGINIKISDTKLKSIDDWFLENKIVTLPTAKKDIKIGEISGSQAQVDNKLLAAALDQEILFTIEVGHQNQKYWQEVYNTILSSFNFVPQQSKIETETVPLDDSSGSDVILEEETIE